MNYGTENGSAIAGEDFVATSGTLDFLPGETAKTVKAILLDDTIKETSENFNLVLSNVSNATISDTIATATINENDAVIDTPKNGSLDVDGSGGQTSFARDGLLISAFLFFYRSDRTDYNILDKFVLDSNAARKKGNDVASFLQDKLTIFDVDGSGQTSFARDGLLISAFLFFYRNDRTDYSVLDKFVLDNSASRKTGNDVAAYLKDFLVTNTAGISGDSINTIDRDIIGTPGDDVLIGGIENDRLFGGSGNDTLIGGAGKDTFSIEINNGWDIIDDFNVAEDLIQITPNFGFINSESVVSSLTNLAMVNDRIVTELLLNANNKITVFSDAILTADNFSVLESIY
jgi:Ca2+-binding RTX toxin-like protein